MFQVFRTHDYSITVLFPIYVYVYALFFEGTVRCQCFLSYLCTDLISKTVSIKLHLMILNLRLTLE